jgi:predicted AAA+ superfamily ATPase
MKIIYGPKGTGKTKAIIDMANNTLEQAKGHVIFITDTNRYTYDLKYQIRFLDVTQFAIQGTDGFRGFIKGIVAASGDNEYIFLDGISRITGKPLSELENIFSAMDKLEKDFAVKFIVTCSAGKEDLPDFVLKYVD